MKKWELARNIQKIHAAILGASYKREGERICVSVVTLHGCEFVFPSGNFIFQFQSQSHLLKRELYFTFYKKRRKNNLVVFPFCQPVAQHLHSRCPVAPWVWLCNTRSFSVVFFSKLPGCADSQILQLREQRSRTLDVEAFGSLCWAFQACPISWMNATTPAKTATFWKQTTHPLPPPSCL